MAYQLIPSLGNKDPGIQILEPEKLLGRHGAINLQRLIIAEKALRLATEDTSAPIFLELKDKISFVDLDHIRIELKTLVDTTLFNCTKLVVRYLTDFKPTEYDLNVEFFHLSETAVQGEMSALIRKVITKGNKTSKMVNLASVRDIEATLSHQQIPDLENEVRFVSEVVEKFAAAINDNLTYAVAVIP